MEKILNQEEIDVLLRAARNRPSKKPDHGAPGSSVVPFVFGQGGGITPQQISSVNLLHETFARNLTQRLSAYLRAAFDVTLVSVEQLLFKDLLQQVAERSYLASIHVQPLDANLLLELDLATSFPVIDLLLGGEGKGDPPARDLTDIEELILQSVVEIIFQELQMAWENLLSLQFTFDRRQQQAQVVRLLPSDERILAISFELQIPERRGTLTLGVPASVGGALLRKISEQSLMRKRRLAPDYVAARQQRLQECRFELEMRLPDTPVLMQELLRLEPGQTLKLQHRIDHPALVAVANQSVFLANPVRAANVRGGLVRGQAQLSAPSGKEVA